MALSRRSILSGGLAVALPVLVVAWFAFAAVQSRRAAAESACVGHIHKIAYAFYEYHSIHGHYPPPFIADKNGKPMHSWRILILPYLGFREVYDQYDFSEPWNSTKNKKVMEHMPDYFSCPNCRGGTYTNYFVVVEPSTLFPPNLSASQRRQWLQGENLARDYSTVIAVVESNHQGIPWTEPRDLTLREVDAVLADVRHCDPSGCAVAMANGSVYRGLRLDDSASIAPLAARDSKVDESKLSYRTRSVSNW